MKRKLESILFIISPENQQLIKKDKVLIGSAPNCDIVIEHPSISHYHAIVKYAVGGGFTITDLGSKNGTFVNGLKTEHTFLGSEDTVTIGKLHVSLQEEFVTDFEFTDENVVQEIIEEKVYIPQQESKNQVLIDDEYCDIIFDESQQITLSNSPLLQTNLSVEDFVELEEMQESFDILEKTDGLAIQVTTLSNGVILEQYHAKVQNSTIYASGTQGPSRIPIDIYEGDKKTPFISIKNGSITVHPLENFQGINSDRSLGEKDLIIQNYGSYQVFVELIPAPDRLKYISQMRREKEFYQQSAKTFAAIVLPMLLLLLIDISVPETKKKLAIIYRKPMKSANNKKIASQTPSKTQENTGHKATKQQDNKLEFAKSGQKQKAKAKPAEKVAQNNQKQAPTKKQSNAKAKTPVKAYKFKMDTKSLFASSNNVSTNKNNAPSSLTGATSATVANTKVSGTASGEIGKMGKDSRGRGTASYGTKGLSANAGMDTAYVEPKTVVLGAMDPELLRKILREYLPQFRHCYQQELVNNSDKIKGIVDLNFEINPNGKVKQIKVTAKDSRFSRRGTDCMAQVLSIIDFPRPKGGGRVAVRQPLSFFAEKERS